MILKKIYLTIKQHYANKKLAYKIFNNIKEKRNELFNLKKNYYLMCSQLRTIENEIEDEDIKKDINNLLLYLNIGLDKNNNILFKCFREQFEFKVDYIYKIYNDIELLLEQHNYKKIIELYKNEYES